MGLLKKIKWENLTTIILIILYGNDIIFNNRYSATLTSWNITDMLIIILTIIAYRVFIIELRKGNLKDELKNMFIDEQL